MFFSHKLAWRQNFFCHLCQCGTSSLHKIGAIIIQWDTPRAFLDPYIFTHHVSDTHTEKKSNWNEIWLFIVNFDKWFLWWDDHSFLIFWAGGCFSWTSLSNGLDLAHAPTWWHVCCQERGMFLPCIKKLVIPSILQRWGPYNWWTQSHDGADGIFSTSNHWSYK